MVILRLFRLPKGKIIYIAFINNKACLSKFSFDDDDDDDDDELFLWYG